MSVWAQGYPATVKPMENTPNEINMTWIKKKKKKKQKVFVPRHVSLGVCNVLSFSMQPGTSPALLKECSPKMPLLYLVLDKSRQ